ncbi:hypothetical protein DFH07DRAFT_952237 [Mycena maculata]|uniref:Uncharacterized protein n=1 Tax=Mycena maculata TaxID=230809 RepID=A0AAD7JYD3_9AGAR|nr:hypothetical protein DFH07DRAFT_952237 [Mycena maculata]
MAGLGYLELENAKQGIQAILGQDLSLKIVPLNLGLSLESSISNLYYLYNGASDLGDTSGVKGASLDDAGLYAKARGEEAAPLLAVDANRIFRAVPRAGEARPAAAADPTGRKLTPEEVEKLGKAITTKKGKLENWFRYQRKKIGNADSPARATNATLNALFRMGASKRHRVHQAVEIFQKRNRKLIKERLTAAGYDALTEGKEADDLEKEMEEEGDDEDDNGEDGDEGDEIAKALEVVRPKTLKSRRMELRKRVVAAAWAEASAEEREAVADVILKEKAGLRERALRGEDEEACKASSPQDLQRGIDALDALYRDFHAATYNATGWMGMTIMGGPNPRMGGELTVKMICFGTTPAGHDFADSCVDFEKNIADPFDAFLRQCSTARDRRVLALTTAAPASSEDVPIPLPRLAASLPAQETAVKATKINSKYKTKKRQASSPAIVEEVVANAEGGVPEEPESGVAAMAAVEEEESSGAVSGLTSTSLSEEDDDAWLASAATKDLAYSAGATFDTTDDFFGDEQQSDDLFFAPVPAPAGKELSSPWPLGMGPPLAPEEAAAIARMERGGIPGGGATMAIDPQLTALSTVADSSPTDLPVKPYPQLRPPYAGAGGAVAAASTRVPFDEPAREGRPFPRPALFQAFTPRRAAPMPTTTPVAAPVVPRTSSQEAGGTWAARRAVVLLGLAGATPPALSTPSLIPTTSSTPVLTDTPAPTGQTGAPPLSNLPSVERVVVTETVVPAQSVLQTRPATKPPAPLKTKVAPAAAKKMAAAKQAKKVATKKDANAVPLADTTNAPDGMALPDAGNTANAEAVGPIFSISNNNRVGARRAAVAEKAQEAAAAATQAEKEAKRGWVRTTQKGHDCVEFTNAGGSDGGGRTTGRTCKPTMFADGQVAQAQVKGRKNPNADLEAALLARVGNGGGGTTKKTAAAPSSAPKRKASAATSAPKAKRRNVKPSVPLGALQVGPSSESGSGLRVSL